MKWANFLHIYQPVGQQPDILEAVTQQSYRPLLFGILNHTNVRLSFNINGALFEVFDKFGYHDVIDNIRELIRQKRLEITGSAKYHAFLPFLNEREIVRQIKANTETLKFYLGKDYNPVGFFPPEMAYSEEIAHIISDHGFKWMILDEIAYNGKTEQVKYDRIYKIPGPDIFVVFRERRPSNLIMSAVVRTYDSLLEAMKKDIADENRFLLTAMDGETFGHHRPGLENLLFDIFDSPQFQMVKVSDLFDEYHNIQEIYPIKSTWASSEEDIEKGIQFLSWSDPENEIHKWQKELVDLALNAVYTMPDNDPAFPEVRQKMDEALASDHFWWASAKPWWSLEEIERGAYENLDVIRNVPKIPEVELKKAAKLYEQIVSTAFNWKRSGKIYQMMKERKETVKIPFKERTFEQGGVEKGVYEGFIAMFKDLEKKAAEKGEYEKAILWRDAIYKIQNKSDIYDAVHAVEMLRMEIPNYEVEKTLDEYTAKYKEIRGGQPEQRS